MPSGFAQIPEWAAAIYDFVKTYGLSDSVMVVDELSSGDDVRGTGACSALAAMQPGQCWGYTRAEQLSGTALDALRQLGENQHGCWAEARMTNSLSSALVPF